MEEKYTEDVLKNGFEQTTIVQPDDFEGKVTTTLIRKRNSQPTSKAILCIHGFNDYFFQKIIADHFLQKGYHFYAMDLRKYGRSILPDQKINNMRDIAEYYQDIDVALSIIKKEGTDKVVLYGHSTGGILVTLYAEQYRGKELFDAIICNSPFYDFNVSWFQKKTILPLLALLGRLNPQISLPIGFSKLYGKSLHNGDYGEWEYNLKWKPHMAPSINAGWVNAIHQAHRKIARGVTINVPILILHSDKSVYPKVWNEVMFEGDAILNVTDIIEKSKKIIAPQKDVIAVENAMHDMVLSRKPVREKVFVLIFEWLDRNLK